MWLVLGFLFLIVVLCDYFLVGTSLVFDYLALIPQYLYLIPFSLLFLSGLFVYRSKRLYLLFPVIGFVFTFFFLCDFVFFNVLLLPTDSSDIRVLSWNSRQWDMTREQQFYASMREYPSDIYMFQEVAQRKARGVYTRVQDEFPGFTAEHYDQFLTISRYAVVSSEVAKSAAFMKTVVTVGNTNVSLYNVHLKRPYYVDRLEGFEEFDERRAEFVELQSYLVRDLHPVIIMGDFNSTRNYPFIRFLESHYVMNNPRSFFSFPLTYSTELPVFRIDYQFASRQSRFTEFEYITDRLSDHRGIRGSLRLE
jgi:endonuclease/exonuclease/phosphatase (EEP) superfamily protein YafD